jgi:hypothetical protein
MTHILQSNNVTIPVISRGAWSVFHLEFVVCSLYLALYAIALLTVCALAPDLLYCVYVVHF